MSSSSGRRGGRGRDGEASWLDGDDNNNSNNNSVPTATKDAQRALSHAAVQLVPFGAQAASSAAAYRAGLVAAQLVGLLLRVSSATPVLGPCLGALGVGFASALAGAAARHARKLCTEGGNPLDRAWWDRPRPADAALDGALGLVLHRALGGRFSAVMPSDLARPGARALDSLPASADGAYAAPGAKRELVRLFRRDGCHHCGTRSGPVVGDHMPPNVYVAGPGPGTPNPGGYRGGDLLLEGEKMLARFRAALSSATGGGIGGAARGGGRAGAAAASGVPARLRQRFYAQCQRCSVRQAVAVRTGRRTLVLHLAPLGGSRPERAAGLVVGLRQGAPPLASDSPVAIVAARVGGALYGAAQSAAAAVREHRARRRAEDEERRRAEERRGGGGGKGRGGGGGGGGGGLWGRGGGGNGSGSGGAKNNSSNYAAVKADGRLAFSNAPSSRQDQATLAWAAAAGAPMQQQQPQPTAASALAAPVQGGLLAGPLYAEFVASAAACGPAAGGEAPPGWGSAGGDPQQQHHHQQHQRMAAAAAGGPSAAPASAAAAGPRGYDAALAAYVTPGGGAAARRQPQQQHQQHYPAPMPLAPQYLLSSSVVAAATAAEAAAPSATPAAAAAPRPAAPGDLSGVVALGGAAAGPSPEDAKRRAQAAFDRHFARPDGAAM